MTLSGIIGFVGMMIPNAVGVFCRRSRRALMLWSAWAGAVFLLLIDCVAREVAYPVDLPAGAAFGERNPELLQRVKLALLREFGDADASYEVGDVVRFPTPDGAGSYAGVVREVGADWLLFDFNHPLAGQPVQFEVKLIGVL